MTLITRCPGCETLFKVVVDQLRVSEGWVRCGYCSEVFDASLHMQDHASRESAPQSQASVKQEGMLSQEQAREQGAIDTDPALPAADWMDRPAAPPETAQESAEIPVERLALTEGEGAAQSVTPPADQALEEVSFVRAARRKAYWRRPAVRATLGLGSLLLLVVLLAQVALQERDHLVAWQPNLRPVLQALCQPLQCRIGPPRNIEAIVVDSSSFSKLRDGVYRLALTLKNQGRTAVALPAVELTLTEAQDLPVVRRVFLPEELDASAGQIDPGAQWSGTFALSLAALAGAERVASYRLVAFYP
jgi:predicted Zn finger-like uncharacterized protein